VFVLTALWSHGSCASAFVTFTDWSEACSLGCALRMQHSQPEDQAGVPGKGHECLCTPMHGAGLQEERSSVPLVLQPGFPGWLYYAYGPRVSNTASEVKQLARVSEGTKTCPLCLELNLSSPALNTCLKVTEGIIMITMASNALFDSNKAHGTGPAKQYCKESKLHLTVDTLTVA
jgi:hypothetical protein